MTTLYKNVVYSRKQLEDFGLKKTKINKIDMDVFFESDKVYFFDLVADDSYRLFTVINKQSFYLK